MQDADPDYQHMVRLDGRTTRCGARPPRLDVRRLADLTDRNLPVCAECVPSGEARLDLRSAARRAGAQAPQPVSEGTDVRL